MQWRAKTVPRSASVVVIGGGIMGASALYHLAEGGCTDTVLLERETLAAGSTGKAAGGLRAQFSDPLNARIGLVGIERYGRFGEQFGADIDFRQDGYLFLLTRPEDVPRFDADLEHLNSLGAGVQRLDPLSAGELVPGVRVDDVIAANWRPDDASAAPEAAVQAYAQAATTRGAGLVQGCTASSIVVEGGRVVAVDSSLGRIATETVILVAGVWSRELAAGVGLDLPVTPLIKHVFFSDAGDTLPERMPITIDYAERFYAHREGHGLLFGGQASTVEDLAPVIANRIPQMIDIGIRGGWSGAYEMSPDANAIVGRASEPAGLIYATGFSGHGFMQGPAVGEHIAQLALDLEPTLDLGSLSVDRFAAGAGRAEGRVV